MDNPTTRDFIRDRAMIRETAELYFFFCDSHESDGVARCFAEDGLFRSLTQSEMLLRGRRDLEAGFRNFTKWGRCCHLITSMNIVLDGETATSRLFAVSYVAGAAKIGDPILVRGLAYSDKWIIEDGRWVLAERVHEALWQFQNTLIPTNLPRSSSSLET